MKLQMCYCAHPYGGFWKAQLSSSHKKQTPRSLVQYLSLIARKRAKIAFLSKIFSFFGGSESMPGPCSFCIASCPHWLPICRQPFSAVLCAMNGNRWALPRTDSHTSETGPFLREGGWGLGAEDRSLSLFISI